MQSTQRDLSFKLLQKFLRPKLAKLVFLASHVGRHFENGRFGQFPIKIRLVTPWQSIPRDKYSQYAKYYILGTSSTVGQLYIILLPVYYVSGKKSLPRRPKNTPNFLNIGRRDSPYTFLDAQWPHYGRRTLTEVTCDLQFQSYTRKTTFLPKTRFFEL